MNLNLTGQSTVKNQIQTEIVQLQDLMDQRLPIWNKLSVEQQKHWVLDGKDSVMTLAWQTYNYLRGFFGEMNDG